MLTDIEIDKEFEERMVIVDKHDLPVNGLVAGDFSTVLYDSTGTEVSNISAGIPVTISELGDGIYKILFTPNELGHWTLITYNSTYFPWGKVGGYRVVGAVNALLLDYLKKILGLSQSNYTLTNPHYDRRGQLETALVTTYENSTDLENKVNQLAQYRINAVHDKRGILLSYKMVEL